VNTAHSNSVLLKFKYCIIRGKNIKFNTTYSNRKAQRNVDVALSDEQGPI
jgi:hypothetical protein